MSVLAPGPAVRAAGVSLAALPPLALYVHIPWCVRKCPYCDFNSHELRGELPEQRYVAALTADLEQALPLVWGRRVHSVFFGGGTPSLLSARALDEILSTLRARLPLSPEAEITLEANPGTFEAHKFAEFRALGVNRLSIGIQSFDPQHLRALGRIHDEREAHRAVEIAHASFDNFNLDSDVRAAGPNARASRGRYPHRHCARTHAPVGVSPDHRAQHVVLSASAASARRRAVRDHAGAHRAGVWRRPATFTTRPRPSPSRSGSAGTISTTGGSVTISASAPVRTASSACRNGSSARSATSILANTWNGR